MALELGSFKKAIQSLTSALAIYSDPKIKTRSTDEQHVLRAGVIQNFVGPFLKDVHALFAALESRND